MFTGNKFGKYEIQSKIGAGGMGEVYAARDSELGRNVAIKLLPAEFSNDLERTSRFRQEARTISALNHPNIITIYEIGENEHGSFLATELVEGRTLRKVIKHENLTMIQSLRLIEQAANALVEAHHASIIHRDIKPENIMVRGDSIVKVLDFGLAKPTLEINGDGSDEENVKTIAGVVMGSARYMSPEQARGIAVDSRTDIWSLGVVMYELLAGSAPFNGATSSDTIANVIYREPEPITNYIENIPSELARILRKALQKDREERYQDVKDFALDIKDLLYDLEHSNSSERLWHISTPPNTSENPTMIHTTVGANHPTGRTMVMTSAQLAASGHVPESGRFKIGIPTVFLIIVAAVASLGAIYWFDSTPAQATEAFERPQISRVNTDGKVSKPAISPDGKYLAYVSGDIGNQSLVVRQISTDSVVTVVPPSNLNYSAVTFSPDGDRVYYGLTRSDFAVNTLYQVPTLGGLSKKLIEDVDSAVTFSPDGKRVAFARHVVDSAEDLILTADLATLEPVELIRSKTIGYDMFAKRPVWSPDGKTILVGAAKRESGYVNAMAIGEINVADGKFTVLNDGRFFAVGNFAWFADGSGFVFSARDSQNGALQIWRSTYPVTDFHPVTNDFNDYADIGLSDNGDTIVTLKGETSSSLWRYSPANKTSIQLTPESRSLFGAHGLLQKTDGSLLFTSKESKEIKLLVADRDGKTPQPLIEDAGNIISPSFSPDGRFIVFGREKDKISRIWRMDSDGSNLVQLSEENKDCVDFNPRFTADGQSIIFQRHQNTDDRMTMMKMSVDGGEAESFYENEKWGVYQPRVSPDGKWFAFTSFDLETFDKKLRIASLDGDRVGKVQHELEYNLINQFMWSPDSQSLTILTSRSGTPNIWRQPIDGSAAVPITDFKAGRILNFTWSADGKDLVLARGNTVNDLLLVRDSSRTSDVENAGSGQQRPLSIRDRLTQIFTSAR